VSILPDPLPLEATTPVTEAVENTFDEVTRSLRHVSHEVQSAISIAASPNAGAAEAFVVQSSRLGLSLLHGYVSAWSSALDGLGLIAADPAEWWWTAKLAPAFDNPVTSGVVRADVTTIPASEPVPVQWVRVAGDKDQDPGNVDLIDRGVGVPTNWDGTCYVSVRQHGDFVPGTVQVSFRVLDARGRVIARTSDPINAILSL
jgi:hypothetical protein